MHTPSMRRTDACRSHGPATTIVPGLMALIFVVGLASACSAPASTTAATPGATPGAPAATPIPSVAAPGAGGCLQRSDEGTLPGPPAATPLPQQPTEVGGDGTRATICTALGDVEFELFSASAPVASENFVNLAEAGYYRGSPFHRIIPGFMIQGGRSATLDTGGPGYTIQDEPFAGEYVRGMVAMARTPQPNSQSSQFFILVADAPHLAGGGYTIFGRVTSGMEVVDEIVSGPRGGPQDDQALEPVLITDVGIQRP